MSGWAVLPWGRRAETWEGAVWSEDPLGHMGENSCPVWSVFGSGGKASPETKLAVPTVCTVLKHWNGDAG